MENKCETPSCNFKKHPNINNNGGTHCCANCKKNINHGKLCLNIPYIDKSFVGKKLLLSYERSGNHLTRFFIELLSECPTLGWIAKEDTPIYLNIFPEEIPFNIRGIEDYNIDNLYKKEHHVPKVKDLKKLIFLVRNPKEVLIRQNNNMINIDSYNMYFKLIDYYNSSTVDKIVFFYEDMLTDKVKFINELYDFLELENPKKKAYVLENIEHLYELSALGKGRAWRGVKSNGELSYYYKQIPEDIKTEFDEYLENKLNSGKYELIKHKYNL